mmetsp:Transcript_12693/g.33980  ORF Transcript_12693/g.33980 Transcript_12693/m.33980 type:complete len:215 (+) Transcript_12693:278-922(+)
MDRRSHHLGDRGPEVSCLRRESRDPSRECRTVWTPGSGERGPQRAGLHVADCAAPRRVLHPHPGKPHRLASSQAAARARLRGTVWPACPGPARRQLAPSVGMAAMGSTARVVNVVLPRGGVDWSDRSILDSCLGHPLHSASRRRVPSGGYNATAIVGRPGRHGGPGVCLPMRTTRLWTCTWMTVRIIHPTLESSYPCVSFDRPMPSAIAVSHAD